MTDLEIKNDTSPQFGNTYPQLFLGNVSINTNYFVGQQLAALNSLHLIFSIIPKS